MHKDITSLCYKVSKFTQLRMRQPSSTFLMLLTLRSRLVCIQQPHRMVVVPGQTPRLQFRLAEPFRVQSGGEVHSEQELLLKLPK